MQLTTNVKPLPMHRVRISRTQKKAGTRLLRQRLVRLPVAPKELQRVYLFFYWFNHLIHDWNEAGGNPG